MKLRKVLVSVLALSMLLSVPAFACEKSHHHHKKNTEVSADASTEDAAAEASSNEDAATEASSTEEAATEASSTDASTAEASTDIAATDASTEAVIEEAIEKNFSIGEVKGNVYENSFFNVKVEAPEDFKFNEEGLMTLVGNYSQTPFAKKATEAFVQVILDNDYPVQLLNANNGKTASLDVYVGYVADNTDDYLNEKALIESKLNDIVDMFKNMGLTDVKTSVGTTTFLGDEHPCMDVNGTMEGIAYNHRYVCIPKDGYVLVIGFGGIEQKDFAPIANATKLN